MHLEPGQFTDPGQVAVPGQFTPGGFAPGGFAPGRFAPGYFDPGEIVIDPQVPQAARGELRRLDLSGLGTGYQGLGGGSDWLVRFRDPEPAVPPEPRSMRPARALTVAAAVLIAASLILGLLGHQGASLAGMMAGLAAGLLGASVAAAARRGRPAALAGLVPLPRATDLTGYYAEHAGPVFHRRYVRPHTDFERESRATWNRAVRAANAVCGAESVRDRVVDADRLGADVPELLWKIAEGLAMISRVRFCQRSSVAREQRYHPAVGQVLRAQQQGVDIGSDQVERWVRALETLAARLDECDAARRSVLALQRLRDADPMIEELVAHAAGDEYSMNLAEDLDLDVRAIIAVTNQAIQDLSSP